MRMPFGKFKGQEVADLEVGYLEWLKTNVNLYGALQDEVEKALSRLSDDIDDEEIDLIVEGGWPCPPITP